MRLNDVPHFTVHELEHVKNSPQGSEPAKDLLRLHGTFNHVQGVRKGMCYLYEPECPFEGDLTWYRRADRRGVILQARWSANKDIQVGQTFPWMSNYIYHGVVTMILTPGNRWVETRYESEDALGGIHDDGYRYWPARYGNPEGIEPVEIIPGGWDHEHCAICSATIGRGGEETAYCNIEEADVWLCRECFLAYGVTRDLSFLFPNP